MNKPILENILTWKGLPVLLSLLTALVFVIFAIAGLQARIGAIEKDHQIFGDVYQRQVDDIKASQLRTEDKLDRLLERIIASR